MDLRDLRRSENVEDRRGSGGRRIAGGLGIGTIIIAAVVFFLGGDPSQVLQLGQQQSDYTEQPNASNTNDEGRVFVDKILGSTEDVWNAEFAKIGIQYREPTLVLFSGQTVSECGGAHAASGPFYCPADKKVYLDLSFFSELNRRFGVEGDFAPAYVIAHEIGHHVQDMMGITTKVHRMQQQVSEKEANRLSVMLELQADFLAGYWAKRSVGHTKLTETDIRSALNAANAIGDDKLQHQSQGHIVPDAFTHGSSEQRMEWFMRGFKANSIEEGNTFQQLGS